MRNRRLRCAGDEAIALVAGVAFAAYAICVWPANFKHAIDGIHFNLPHISNSWWSYHGHRELAFRSSGSCGGRSIVPAWSTWRGGSE